MSTVAWDGHVLAVDRCAWTGNRRSVTCKMHEVRQEWPRHGWPAGMWASCGEVLRTRMILKALMTGDPMPTVPTDDAAREIGIFVDAAGSWYTVTASGVLLRELGTFGSSGHGAEFALGALAAGATARSAVELAEKWTDSAGFGVDTWSPNA